MGKHADYIKKLLEPADIRINGNRLWDICVHDNRFYHRFIRDGSLGLGDAYLDGWWDAEKPDQFFYKLLMSEIDSRIGGNLTGILLFIKSHLSNQQRKNKAYEIGRHHYDIGNDLYRAMFDRRMVYTCACWDNAGNLDEAQGLAKAVIEDYGATYPSMIKCFNDDLPACWVHLKYPHEHRRSIRTTNLIERSFVEQKRRTKIIPNHVNEKGAMKLVYGTLIRAARRWQRVSMDQADLILLKTLRQTMCNEHQITLNDDRISFKLAA